MDGKYVDGNLIISHLMPPLPFKRGPVRSLLSAVNNNTASSLIFCLISSILITGKYQRTFFKHKKDRNISNNWSNTCRTKTGRKIVRMDTVHLQCSSV